MGRGQGKGTDLGNNRPSSDPSSWRPAAHDPVTGEPVTWRSRRHKLTIVVTGNSLRIKDAGGEMLRGKSGRERRFSDLFAAMLAANLEAGVERWPAGYGPKPRTG